MSNRIIAIVLVVLIAIVAFLMLENFEGHKEDKVVYVAVTNEPTVNATVEVTPEPIYVIVTQEPTKEPLVIYVTPEPTKEPQIIYITPEPTKEPQIIYVTPEPEVQPTATPIVTQEPTQEPNVTATPTVEPTQIPTSVPTVVPTVAPTDVVSEIYTKIEKEMSTLIMSGGIYPDYESASNNDLYTYIVGDGKGGDLYSHLAEKKVDGKKLFTLLRKPFEEGIATWTAMEFVDEYGSIDRLGFALESSVCDSCGRIVIEHSAMNKNAISRVFDEIQRNGEYEKANEMLLDYLCQYTVKNPDNPNERLFIACNE